MKGISMIGNFLITLEQLYDAAIEDLGPMDQGSYSDFVQKARKLALSRGIRRLCLYLNIKLKEPTEFGITEQPYPISEEEWDILLNDLRRKAAFIPSVFIVNADEYRISLERN